MYSQEVADHICERVADGMSLRLLCNGTLVELNGELKNLPNRSTVARWLIERPDFATKYARAREMQADYMDDLILHVAAECTPQTAAADRVKIDAYKWRASKLASKVYGDKIETTHAGEIGVRSIERHIIDPAH